MSAIGNPERTNHWLTIIAVVALAYALTMIAIVAAGGHQSPARWIGRLGSLAVIAGVLVHQRSIAATWTIAAGIVAIVAGFALGIVGY